MVIKSRPLRRAIKIGITSFGEFGPIAAQQLSETFIFVRVFPVSWKRIAQEEELFSVVRSETRTFAGVDVGEVVQV